MKPSSPKEIIVDWLSKRAGVDRQTASSLSDATIAAIVADPRRGISTLFQVLERSAPQEHRIAELQKLIGGISSGVKNAVLAAATPENISFAEKCERMMSSLQLHGTVVFDRAPENADQICILLKHMHSYPAKILSETKKNVSHGMAFMQQENAIKKILDTTEQQAGENMRLYLEGFPMGAENARLTSLPREPGRPPVAQIETMASHIATYPAAATHFFQQLDQMMRQGVGIERTFAGYHGDERFIMESMQKGRNWHNKVHGMFTPQREQSLGAPSLAELIRRSQEDHIHTHTFVADEIAKDTRRGMFHSVVLGGGHFMTGYRTSNPRFQAMIQALEPFSLEQCLTSHDALKSSRIVVMEPQGYKELDSTI